MVQGVWPTEASSQDGAVTDGSAQRDLHRDSGTRNPKVRDTLERQNQQDLRTGNICMYGSGRRVRG